MRRTELSPYKLTTQPGNRTRRPWFGQGQPEMVGPDGDKAVPPMFFKVVVYEKEEQVEPVVLAFLFPHQRKSHGHIEDFLVTVDVLEAIDWIGLFE